MATIGKKRRPIRSTEEAPERPDADRPKEGHGGLVRVDATRPAKRSCRCDAEDQPEFAFFRCLPDELLLAILASLGGDPCSIISWGQTSRRHHAISDDQQLWRRLCALRFGPRLFHVDFVASGKCHKWLYQAQAHTARATGRDVGAARACILGSDYVYWGECIDGAPCGYGVAVGLPSPYCRASETLARTNFAGSGDGGALPICQGQWLHGQMCGYGTQTIAGRFRYEGECKDNMRHGRGTYVWANGDRYDGEWQHDKRNGHGVYAWANGDRYDGSWKDNDFDGYGILTRLGGGGYKGHFCADLYHGHGTHTWSDGSHHTGDWKDDLREGAGTLYYPDGSCIRGEWHAGVFVSGKVDAHRSDPMPCDSGSPCVACSVLE
jgi:hypothetical protein